jgi:chorismate mutase
MTDDITDKLFKLRQKIDEIDQSLLSLLSKRAQCSIDIGKIKKLYSLPVYNQAREEALMTQLYHNNKGPLTNTDIKQIFELLITISRDLQVSGDML